MASIEQTTRAAGALRARLDETLAGLRAAMHRRSLYNRTLREMHALSDRELADLGLHRSELRRIAWQAANEY